ncbi:MAG TPA: O-antigen ligase family protein, partial [Candidatus Woesebacteria bacterium]|nr:O-antigen ligase family protein [Candidatus Woesebacteria bacterium]
FVYLIFFDLRHNPDLFTSGIINKILLFWSLALGFIGLGQYLFLPDTRFLLSSGWDDHYFRVIGSFFDPNFTGLILSLAIIWGINNFYSQQSLIKIQFFKLFLLFLLLFPAFFLTYSRSSYLALIAGLAVYFVLKAKKRNLFYLLILFVLVVILLPRPGGEGVRLERTASMVLRLENWQVMFSLWKKHPLFGVGFNNLRYAIRKTGYLRLDQWREVHSAAGADNSYLFILVTAGLMGLAGFFFYCFSTVKNILHFSEDQKRLLFSSYTAVFIHCFFTNSFFYPWVFLWLMTIQSLED